MSGKRLDMPYFYDHTYHLALPAGTGLPRNRQQEIGGIPILWTQKSQEAAS